MKKIRISDVTMTQHTKQFSLSFREKLKLAKLLDGLGISVIELEGSDGSRTDALRIKSVAATVKNSIVAVPVMLDKENIQQVWEAVKLAKSPRLQVKAPVSSVQIEYLYHKKPEGMLEAVCQAVADCCKLCKDVEFVAEDATRAEPEFLHSILQKAIAAGAETVTVCDSAGKPVAKHSAFRLRSDGFLVLDCRLAPSAGSLKIQRTKPSSSQPLFI